MEINVIGAGLAGSEAAFYLAERGVRVTLYDIKPKAFTPAHENENYCELVCSNSLKGADPYTNACGLLKEEMRAFGSLTMAAAEESRVAAGGALAVDRDKFAAFVTEKIKSHPNIKCVCEEVTSIPEGWNIIATGPLTTNALSGVISGICGGQLHFYDASAPIVSKDSIDFSKCFFGDRYGRGGDDYINCPLEREEYLAFVDALTHAERAVLHEFEKREIFEGCMPVEVMASRGVDCLRFANFKPVGLGEERHYAVLQLRAENSLGTAYNLVGCQTNLKFPEQKRVFSMIPALKEAEFLRYGVMHRNTFLNSPACLCADFSLKSDGRIFFAGQITGVEGYVESAASGILAAVHAYRKMCGKGVKIPDEATILGALSRHISTENGNFQPMNANFGLLPPPPHRIKNKKERYAFMAGKALESIRSYVKDLEE